jgi:hypothetical protein
MLLTQSTQACGGICNRAGGQLYSPYVSVSSNGTGTVIWIDRSTGTIETRSRSINGRLTGTQMLSTSGDKSLLHEFQAASSPDGTSVVVMGHDHRAPTGGTLYGPFDVRMIAPNGSLGPIQQLADLGDPSATVLDVAIDHSDRATVVSEAHLTTDGGVSWQDVVFAQRVEPTGSLDAPITIAVINSPDSLESINTISHTAGTDSVGDVVVTWVQSDMVNGPPQLWAQTLGPDGTLGSAIDVVNAPQANSYEVSVDPGGQATFVWDAPPYGYGPVLSSGLADRIMAPGGGLGPIMALSPATSDLGPDIIPAFTALANGSSIVAWAVRSKGSSGLLRERAISPSGLSPPRAAASPQPSSVNGYGLGFLSDGDAVVADGNKALAFAMVVTLKRSSVCPSPYLPKPHPYMSSLLMRKISSAGTVGATQTINTRVECSGLATLMGAAISNSGGYAAALLQQLHGQRGLYITAGRVR